MHIKSILTATALALATGLGSASAGERFTTLEGISAVALAPSAMMSVRGAHFYAEVGDLTGGEPDKVVQLTPIVFGDHGLNWPGGDNGINTAESVGKTPIGWNH